MTIQPRKEKGTVHMGLDRHILALLDILKMEIRSFNSMNELLILEEKYLVRSDVAGLDEVVGRQSDVLSSIACLEKSRTEILERIVRESGWDGPGPKISDLARMTGDPLRKELLETAEVLAHIHADMKRKKNSNALLIRQGMIVVENDMRLILRLCGRSTGKQTVYTSAAARDSRMDGMYLDGKA